jgi:hypothetical protein
LSEAGGTGTIDITVPAGATVNQVLLYWQGLAPLEGPVDVDFEINGVTIDGTDPEDRISEPVYFNDEGTPRVPQYSYVYRLDITALSLVSSGANSLEITGLDGFAYVTDGAGILVVYELSTVPLSTIDLRDGNDLAFVNWEEPRKSTVPQTFNFPAASATRTATLALFFASVQGDLSGGGTPRPNSIEVRVDGSTIVYSNILGSGDGPEWDTAILQVEIPAGATELTVQAFSRDDDAGASMAVSTLIQNRIELSNLPASLFWLVAGLSVPTEPPEGGEGCTPGYWKQPHHYGNWAAPYAPETLFGDVFDDAFPGMTLNGVLWQGGGGLRALGRHTVAALLNAASSSVEYDLTPSYVVDRFNEVYPGDRANYNSLKDMFEGFNEQHCPLGRAERDPAPLGRQDLDTRESDSALLQNFPNPFNPETQIAFTIPQAFFVTVKIYNTLGEEIRNLVEGQYAAGVHTVIWDAKDDSGKPVTSGLYIYRLTAGNVTQVRTMNLLR